MTPTLFEIEGPTMKWFQLDSDTPVDPKFARLLQDGLSEAKGGTDAHAAFGAAMLLCCFVADHGRGAPGHGVDKNGAPLDLDDMAFATRFKQQSQLVAFLDELAALRLIDRARWESERVVVFPAMFNRADEYSRRKWGNVDVSPDGSGVVGTVSGDSSTRAAKVEKGRPTRQDSTLQNKIISPAGQLLDLFCELHLKRVGTKAAISRPKDLALLARLHRDRVGQDPDAAALIRAFFASKDEWLQKAGYSVGVLVSQAPKLIAALRLGPGATTSARTVARRAGAGAKAGKYSGVGE